MLRSLRRQQAEVFSHRLKLRRKPTERECSPGGMLSMGRLLWETRPLRCHEVSREGKGWHWLAISTQERVEAQTRTAQEGCCEEEASFLTGRDPAAALISARVAASCYWFDCTRPSLTLSRLPRMASISYLLEKHVECNQLTATVNATRPKWKPSPCLWMLVAYKRLNKSCGTCSLG